MTKAEQVRERVDALVDSGVRKADAFRQLGEEYDQPPNSIRGAYYQATRGTGSGSRAARDPIADAVSVLEKAIAGIDTEIETAKQRVDDAQAAYKQLRDSADERRKAMQAKIDALKA